MRRTDGEYHTLASQGTPAATIGEGLEEQSALCQPSMSHSAATDSTTHGDKWVASSGRAALVSGFDEGTTTGHWHRYTSNGGAGEASGNKHLSGNFIVTLLRLSPRKSRVFEHAKSTSAQWHSK